MQRQPEILRLLRIIYKKFLVWSVFSPPCSRTLIILKLKKYLKLETLNFFLTSVNKRTNCPAIYGFDWTKPIFDRTLSVNRPFNIWSLGTAAGGRSWCLRSRSPWPGGVADLILKLLVHISKNFLFKILLPWKFVALPFYTHFF